MKVKINQLMASKELSKEILVEKLTHACEREYIRRMVLINTSKMRKIHNILKENVSMQERYVLMSEFNKIKENTLDFLEPYIPECRKKFQKNMELNMKNSEQKFKPRDNKFLLK
jgi:hypothetical protein